MAAFTSIALGVAAAAGVVGTVMQVNQQKKAAKQQDKQLQEQKDAAREAAKQQTTREDTGAKVKLGSDDAGNKSIRKTSSTGTATRTGAVASSVGGLSASTKLGL